MADTNSALLLPAPGPGASATNSVELRGIKGPVPISNSYAWIAWLLGALLLGVILWKLWQKYRKKIIAPKPAVIIPAHRKAKDRLRTARELMSDPYAFCSLVSDVVRGYIEERFDLHAPERTTEEFMAELRISTQLHVDHKTLLEDFLTRCDLVKFARHEPPQPELEALLEAAFRFIEETSLTKESSPPPALDTANA